MTVRVIPRLDIKGPNLVKGIHLEGLRVLGRPETFAAHYYEHGADELLFMDVVASLYGRNSLLEVIERTASAIFIPLTVGGGLRTIDDIRDVLRAGADKVAINTAAIGDPDFVRRAATRFGSSTIVVSVEAMRLPDGNFAAFTDNGREETGLDAVDWALQAANLGAGEIMITSIDREGTGEGFDLDLTQRITSQVDVPVIACGGAGSAAHVSDVIANGGADAVGIASVLHYEYLLKAGHEEFDAPRVEGNVEYLRQRAAPKRLELVSLPEIKIALQRAGVHCRVPL